MVMGPEVKGSWRAGVVEKHRRLGERAPAAGTGTAAVGCWYGQR